MIRFGLIFILSSALVFCGELKNNFDILDSLAKEASAEICKNLTNDSSYYIIMKGESGIWLFEQRIFSNQSKFGLRFFEMDSSAKKLLPQLDFSLLKFGARYSLVHNKDDFLKRTIELNSLASIRKINGEIEALPELSYIYSDTVSRQDMDFIENSAYPFAKGEIPEKPGAFWENILEPAIIIGSAAVTILILFTVRSE